MGTLAYLPPFIQMRIPSVFHSLDDHPVQNRGAALKSKNQGPVVQSIVSLMNSLRGQLVKCFMTLLPNTHIFFVEKMREAFALQKLLTFFST